MAVVAGEAGGGHAQATTFSRLAPIQKRLLSGLLRTELTGGRVAVRATRALPGATSGRASRAGADYLPGRDGTCPQSLGGNVKVNQNCLNLSDPDLQGRGQAQNETAIAQDPRRPSTLVASSNDYRRGDANCYAYLSLNGGRTWADSTAPMSFTRGDQFGTAREYWQAGGDTSVAFDTRGNAYLSCQMFNRGSPTSPDVDESSGFFVFRSTGNHGASWNFPARPVTVANDAGGTGSILEDKALMAVDANVKSPYRDRIYVTWTEFAPDGSAYIWESHSSDYGETFSPRVLVSHDSPLCVNNYNLGHPHGNCNENQFSYPFVAADGTVYVAWANFNNATGHPVDDAAGDQGTDNRNQMLFARSSDGGRSFSAPVLAGDYYDLPDCATYTGQDAGVACVPTKGKQTSYFRAVNYPEVAADPRNPRHVVVTFGSYINRYSNEKNGCVPEGFSPSTGLNLFDGVTKAGACSNKILVSTSTDGGAAFTGTEVDPRRLPVVVGSRRQLHTDQFWQGTAWSQGRLAVDYYDRSYGDDERTGFSDLTLSGSRNLRGFASRRVTSSSMPPPTQFDGLFFGDYITLSAREGVAHPAWMDTRNRELFACTDSKGTVTTPPTVCSAPAPNARYANDQDVFTDTMRIPAP